MNPIFPAEPAEGSDPDAIFMALAFDEAWKVRGSTYPNPAVGAILVREGIIVGRGGTRPPGQAHAEIVALEQAGEAARGATLYVTLEPCCHYGKTPPCSQAISAAGVLRVVVAIRDPNPKVDGGGLRDLDTAGIEVRLGVMGSEAREFYRFFFHFLRYGRPMILLKAALSVDGRINESPGVRTVISGSESNVWAHKLRSQVDAILVGAGTLRSDNPDLRTSLVPGPSPRPLVLSRSGHLPPEAKVFSSGRKPSTRLLLPIGVSAPEIPDWVERHVLDSRHLPSDGADSSTHSLGASLTGIASGEGAMQALSRHFLDSGYHSVLVEGGRSLWGLFLNSGTWDRLYLLTSPKALPLGQRWDEWVREDWGKLAYFGNFQLLGEDMLLEISHPNASTGKGAI